MISRYAATFVRPSNGTVYAAGDVVCNAAGDVMNFFGATDMRQGRITAAKLSITNDNTTNGAFELFFFRDNANLPTLVDNAAFTMTAACEDDLIGYTTFALESTGTSGGELAWDANTGLNILFTQKETSGVLQGLYAVLVATAAYAPLAPASTVDVVIHIEDDRP